MLKLISICAVISCCLSASSVLRGQGIDQALSTLRETHVLPASLQKDSALIFQYNYLAEAYEEQGNFNEAIKCRLLELDYARDTKWIEMETRAQRHIAYTFKNAGDYENAFIHLEALGSLEDSLARFEAQSQFQELEMKYESRKKDLEIEYLRARILRLILWVLGGLMLGGLLFLLYFKKTNKKLLEQNAALFEKNIEIQKALTEGQNIERKRMAIELHDNINAKIAAAKWILETINTPDKSHDEQQVIRQLVDSMSDIYEDVRFISHNLVPKDIENKKLSEIFHQLIQNLNHNQKIKFGFTTEGDEKSLDNSLKLQCYAMTMELIHNCIRHSGCREASLHLGYENDQLKIRVEDDGKGFDPNFIQSGTGLKNIATRLQSVNGSISFGKPHDQGSSIMIQIPFERNTRKVA